MVTGLRPTVSLSPGHFSDAGRSKGTVLSGREAHEMARRDTRATPLASELSLLCEHFALESEELALGRRNGVPIPLDHTTRSSGFENFARRGGVARDRLQPIDGFCERQLRVFEPFEQLDAELHRIVGHITLYILPQNNDLFAPRLNRSLSTTSPELREFRLAHQTVV